MGSTIKTGILGFTEIHELIEDGVIEFANHNSVNSNSLNVTLGNKFLAEQRCPASIGGLHYDSLEFSKRESPHYVEIHGGIHLGPGAFCLASLVEKVNLPNNMICHVMLRSSAARMGLEHSYAGFGDSGYSGHLTLELKNFLQYHSIHLRGGDQICQLVFQRGYPVPDDRTYGATGAKYSGDVGPQTIKKEHGTV